MQRKIPVTRVEDIPPHLRDTAVGALLRYHNLGEAAPPREKAELLVGMCMDNRKALRIPENFAFILRAGGGNLRYSEFKVSFAIAIGGVTAIALLAHTQCGMVNLQSRREAFVEGLVENAGWEREAAEEHFMNFAPMFEIGNAIDFVLGEAGRIRRKYPRILTAPLLYDIEDGLLYPLRED